MLNLNLISFFFGALAAFLIASLYQKNKRSQLEHILKQRTDENEKEIKEKSHLYDLKIQKEEFEFQKKCDEKWRAHQKKIEREINELKNKEDQLKQAAQQNQKTENELLLKNETLSKLQDDLDLQKEHLLKENETLTKELEKISSLTKEQAAEKLFDTLSLEVKKKCAVWGHRYFKERKEKIDQEATELICNALHRVALACASKMSIDLVHLPSEEMKSRIIGREGRNIHLLENLLGVNLLMDETPKTVVISSMDPVRKAVAKEVIEKLIQDGRIHPTKIEEEYEKAKLYIEKKIYKKAEDYALKLGLCDLNPKMLRLLSKMDLLNSLGQNLLDHSYHVALIMGVIASELNLDASLAKRIGFLHDIGKASDAELEGSHALIGYKLAKKYGESEEVANGIGCHHEEMNPKTIEASLLNCADSISAARPGARADGLQHYVKRMKKLEDLAKSFDSVEKAYVLQAGREIRIIAFPDKVDDASLPLLAKQIAERISKQMNHPGKIKISVMRQRQVIEFAST